MIDGGTVNVAAGSTLAIAGTNGFTSGILGGAGTANISGTFTWTGGSMVGAGTTNIAASATLVQDGYTYLETGRLLNNAGLIELHSDKYLSTSGTPVPVLHNTGTIRKTGGAGEFTLYVALANQGRVDSTSGKLNLQHSAAVVQSGIFSGPDDTAHVVFKADTFTLGASARLLGSVEVGGATVNVAPGSTLAIPGRLLLTSGELGGAGTVNVTGTLVWTGGGAARTRKDARSVWREHVRERLLRRLPARRSPGRKPRDDQHPEAFLARLVRDEPLGDRQHGSARPQRRLERRLQWL